MREGVSGYLCGSTLTVYVSRSRKPITSMEVFPRWGLFLLLAITLSACSGPEGASQQAGSQEIAPQTAPRFQVLVFSKTTGFRHGSITAGIAAVERLGAEHGFAVDVTEDASVFHSDTLSRYDAVIFLNTSGDMLDAAQQAAFEAYVQGGGGFVGGVQRLQRHKPGFHRVLQDRLVEDFFRFKIIKEVGF